MRQVGVLAAAGEYALGNLARLATTIGGRRGWRRPWARGPRRTLWPSPCLTLVELGRQARERGVLIGAMGPTFARL